MKRLIFFIFLNILRVSVEFSYDIEAKYLYKLDRGCKDIDIRFNCGFFNKLEKCEKIHGFLRISYLDFDEKIKPFDIREITGYLLIDNVKNLKSLSQLFPNLTLIRGEKLNRDELSLVIVNNDELESIDISSKIYINKGKVRIKNNKKLKLQNLNGNEIKNFKLNNEFSCSGIAKKICFSKGQHQNFCISCTDDNVMTCDDDLYCCKNKNCHSKICKDFYFYSNEFNDTTCLSDKSGTIELENRYLVEESMCNEMGRESIDGVDCSKYSKCDETTDEFRNFTLNSCVVTPEICNATENKMITIESAAKVKRNTCLKVYKVEILNYQEEISTFNSNLKIIEEIETCLIVRNSSAVLNLDIFEKLQKINKGCDWNGSTYKIIIEDNRNFNSLWRIKSKLRLIEGEIFLNANPSLKEDTNGFFKCKIFQNSVEIIAKTNSALIMTDFDMKTGTQYGLTYESKHVKLSQNMTENYLELIDLTEHEIYTLQFNINGNSSNFCVFQTAKSDELVENINIIANNTEIILNWALTKDVEYLKSEGFSYYIKKVSTDAENCRKNKNEKPKNAQKFGKYFLSALEMNFNYFENLDITNDSILFNHLDNDTCYEINIFICTKLNLFFCEEPKTIFAQTKPFQLLEVAPIITSHHPKAKSFSIMKAIMTVTLIILCGCLIYFYVTRRRKYKSNELKFTDIKSRKITLLESRIIGRGSFGVVYVGYLDDNENDQYAVKVGNTSLDLEAELLSKLKTFHIVKFIDYDRTRHYLVMELMTHRDLKSFLIKNRPRPPTNGNYVSIPISTVYPCQIALQIADAMLFLHDQNLIHNDLAARNCLVQKDFTVKIGDFGLARFLENGNYYRVVNPRMLPLRWLAPEALDSPPRLSKESDVYSFGVMIYELVTFCEHPYRDLKEDVAVEARIRNGQILELPQNVANVREFTELLGECCKFKPAERFNFQQIILFLLQKFNVEENFRAKFENVSYFHSRL